MIIIAAKLLHMSYIARFLMSNNPSRFPHRFVPPSDTILVIDWEITLPKRTGTHPSTSYVGISTSVRDLSLRNLLFHYMLLIAVLSEAMFIRKFGIWVLK